MSVFDQSIFRAYDMRGTYPNQMNEQVAYATGQAFVKVMQAKKVIIGRDVRTMGPSMEDALIKGVTEAGADVIKIGVISTEMLYFATATVECDGGMSITASHLPSQWSGIKFIGPEARPITREAQLGEMYDFVNSGQKISEFQHGSVTSQDLLPSYISYMKRFVPQNLPSLKVVANVNFGANGKYIDAITEGLPLELTRLNWQEDGSFPKGTPDPLLPSNRKEITATIQATGANFGVAWDADADRAFFYDEQGRFFHGYYITALLIKHFLQLNPGATVLAERRLVRANQDAANEGKGRIFWSMTGHGFIKKNMRQEDAVFGGEMSGHFYYRDTFYADSGLVTFLTVTQIFGDAIRSGKKVSELLNDYMARYPIMPEEANYITDQAKEIIDAAVKKYADAEQDMEDGLSANYPDWHFSLRMSQTEPVLRLNVEAKTPELLETKQAELINLITSMGAARRNDG